MQDIVQTKQDEEERGLATVRCPEKDKYAWYSTYQRPDPIRSDPTPENTPDIDILYCTVCQSPNENKREHQGMLIVIVIFCI
jgi:hypothetical protein